MHYWKIWGRKGCALPVLDPPRHCLVSVVPCLLYPHQCQRLFLWCLLGQVGPGWRNGSAIHLRHIIYWEIFFPNISPLSTFLSHPWSLFCMLLVLGLPVTSLIFFRYSRGGRLPFLWLYSVAPRTWMLSVTAEETRVWLHLACLLSCLLIEIALEAYMCDRVSACPCVFDCTSEVKWLTASHDRMS